MLYHLFEVVYFVKARFSFIVTVANVSQMIIPLYFVVILIFKKNVNTKTDKQNYVILYSSS